MTEFIVGIGASAGGLDAVNQLFDNMPVDTDAAFVLVQHLSPDHKSLMPELLAKRTIMQVYQAKDDMVVKPNCIYVIPSKKTITLNNGRLKLKDKEETINLAIDIFFESLAKDKNKNAIAIVLSGTGSDGTKGIEAVHKHGGLVIVQDPMTAMFDGMPVNAINSGNADLILSPDMMPEEIVAFMKDIPVNSLFNSPEDENIFQSILALVKRTTSCDFSLYKRGTIYRRMAKRMMEVNFRSLKDYYELLISNGAEIKLLLRELLINVTKFFRDEEAFNVLKNEVIPIIYSNKKAGDTIKLWVAACSSGEEAYSLGILFEEYQRRNKLHGIHIKIFATDIDSEALETASKGIYTKDQLSNVGEERINQFFDKENTTYRVNATIRKMVVFARHDVTRDPPFSHLDLITCRNMLIYMSPLLQKNVLRSFHFAVNEGGFLFLGPSENIDTLKDAVKEVDRKWKIFKVIRKINLEDGRLFLTPFDKQSFYQTMPDARPKTKNALHNLPEIFRDTLFEGYSFAGIFIDREGEVKQAMGSFKEFLNFPEGQFNFNLLKMVSRELSIALGVAIRKAIQDDEKVVLKQVKMHDEDKTWLVNIIVKPYLQQNEFLQPFLFVVLNKEEQEAKRQEVPIDNLKIANSLELQDLEKELKDTRENLQMIIEELESANEELQSHSEEMITSNEELQTTNEELQSLNEELHTVSAEYQTKIKELLELNEDLNNYFRTSDVRQLLVDKKMIIRKFSPAITEQINLVEGDIGRSITDFTTKLHNLDLLNDIKEVMKTNEQLEKEVKLQNNRVYLMRIHPYLKLDKTTDGVVINFFDITEIRKLNSIVEGVFNSSLNAIGAFKLIKNDEGQTTDYEWQTANSTAEKLFNHSSSLAGKRLWENFPGLKEEHADSFLKATESGDSQHFEYFQPAANRWFELAVVKMMEGLVVTFNDITDRKKASDRISESYEELKAASMKLSDTNLLLEQSNMDLMQFASVASHDLKEPLRKIQVFGHQLESKLAGKLDEAENQYLAKMITAAGRMQKLIEDILTLSKLSNKDAEFVPTNLNDILTRLIDDLEITLKEKNATVAVDKFPEMHALPGQMHQLFQNLIMNALKFNKNEKPVVRILNSPLSNEELKRLHLNSGKKYMRIIIEDNGIGFEKQYTDKIFGIFQRLHGSEYPGTGIGLAISKKIVDNHNGTITAESEPNKGSKFSLIFPYN